MKLNEFISSWEDILDKYSEARKIVIRQNPNWKEDDPRIAIFGLTGNVLVSGLINAKLFKSCLIDKEWWRNYISGISEENIQKQADQYIIHTKTMTYILFFSYFESEFRRLFLLVLPGQCNNGTDSFSNLYNKLLKHLDSQQFLPLLDLSRELRNLIHNNGRYISKLLNDKEIEYKGVLYAFVHGRQIDFAYQELFFLIYKDILEFLEYLVNHKDIRRL